MRTSPVAVRAALNRLRRVVEQRDDRRSERLGYLLEPLGRPAVASLQTTQRPYGESSRFRHFLGRLAEEVATCSNLPSHLLVSIHVASVLRREGRVNEKDASATFC
ncbi:MAG: hypothetical protein ABII82_20940 [Verrucomicrobiota bacterium]